MQYGDYQPSDWRWKERGHKLRNEIVKLKEEIYLKNLGGQKKRKRERQGIRNVYRLMGAHFSELQGQPLRDAVELLERQKTALEEILKIPPLQIVKKKGNT